MEVAQAVPNRKLPPLQPTSISSPSKLGQPEERPKPKKRSPRRKQTGSPELIESPKTPSRGLYPSNEKTSTASRSLPPLSESLVPLGSQSDVHKDQQLPTPSNSTTSKNARNRRRQGNTRKRSPRDEPSVITNGHAITNMLSDEDVVPVDKLDDMVSMTTLPGYAKHNGNSQPQEKVYVQTNSGFTSHTKDWIEARQALAVKTALENQGESFTTRSSEVALSFHKAFLFFTLLIHGILAGISIWEVLVAFILNNQGSAEFIRLFQTIALPLQTTFYISVVLCLVSAMDRFNLSKFGRTFFHSLIKVDGKAWMVILYFLSLLFNVGLTGLDHWIATANSPVNSTLTSAFLTANIDDSLTKWHAVNVLRALFAVFAWVLIALHPDSDNTSSNLFGS